MVTILKIYLHFSEILTLYLLGLYLELKNGQLKFGHDRRLIRKISDQKVHNPGNSPGILSPQVKYSSRKLIECLMDFPSSSPTDMSRSAR